MRFVNAQWFTMNAPVVARYFEAHPPAHAFLRVFFQDEHNLVLPGGRSVDPTAPLGAVPSLFDPSQRYHVRIAHRAEYSRSDVIVEYNRPNLENIVRSGALPEDVLDRIVYAPSLPFEYAVSRARSLPVITNIYNETEPRRADLLNRLQAVTPEFRNVQGVRDLAGLEALYSAAKILVNAHQTWHHHAIEEFRVLPALSRGCVVISEDVPLRETIPYHEHIIWCRYEQLADVTAEVHTHYEDHFERIHGPASDLGDRLKAMRAQLERELGALLADDRRFAFRERLRRRFAGLLG